jgi:hypothetical protein
MFRDVDASTLNLWKVCERKVAPLQNDTQHLIGQHRYECGF